MHRCYYRSLLDLYTVEYVPLFPHELTILFPILARINVPCFVTSNETPAVCVCQAARAAKSRGEPPAWAGCSARHRSDHVVELVLVSVWRLAVNNTLQKPRLMGAGVNMLHYAYKQVNVETPIQQLVLI